MARFSFRLTERAEDAAHPLNNLALAFAFAGVGLLNSALNLIPGGGIGLLRLIF